MTNYELIKNMSAEDLAIIIVKTEDLSGPDYCKNKKECDDMLDADIDIPAENCVKCCLDWPKEESDE